MKPKSFIGIDPGKTGAAALITDEGNHEILDYPGSPSLIVETFMGWESKYNIIMAALEKVGARPGQGVVSMFTFGRNLGAWEGIISTFEFPFMMPTPRQWQKGIIDCHGRSPRDPPMAVTNIPPSRKYLESIRSFSQICLHFSGSMKISLIKQPIEGIQ